MSQYICVVGTVATDPRLVQIGSGVRLCSFRLGSSERRFDRAREEWVDGATNWFTVNVFHQLGEHAAQSLAKGQRVVVQGKLKIRNWERDGAKGTAVDIEADAVGHDLRWGVSQFTRMSSVNGHSSPDTSAETPQSDQNVGGEAKWASPLSEQHGEPALAQASPPF